jgi:HK97 gp10 family phage protein
MAVTYKSRIPEILLEIPVKVDLAIAAGSELVARAAKERAPVRTGKLRDSIGVRRERRGTYSVGPGEFYGMFVEFGTSHNSAHPFMVPGLEQSRAEVLAAVNEALHRL